MSPSQNRKSDMDSEASSPQDMLTPQYFDVIVVGTGPVGIRFVEEFSKLNNQKSYGVQR